MVAFILCIVFTRPHHHHNFHHHHHRHSRCRGCHPPQRHHQHSLSFVHKRVTVVTAVIANHYVDSSQNLTATATVTIVTIVMATAITRRFSFIHWVVLVVLMWWW